MRKNFLRIFAVFLMFFYAETGISATITLCGEEYKLKVPLISKKTVSFKDKFGDEVQIYSLTSEIVNTFDNRTFTDIPHEELNLENAHLIYVKNNKVFGLSEKDVFYFLDHNADKCSVLFDFKKYEKIYPLSKEYNFDYSNLFGAMIADFGYIGDTEGVGRIGEDSEQDYYTAVEEKNSALTPELRMLLDNSHDLSKGFTVPKNSDKTNTKYSMLYDNESFNTHMIETLYILLSKGINHLYVLHFEGYDEEDIEEYIRENDGDISDADYMVYGIFLDELFVAFNYATPLMMAVYAGYNDVATYLLEHGANPAYSNGNADALLYAVVTNNKEMIHKLVEAGAPVILSNVYKNSVISYARTGTKEETGGTLEELMNEFLDKETINYLKQNAYKE